MKHNSIATFMLAATTRVVRPSMQNSADLQEGFVRISFVVLTLLGLSVLAFSQTNTVGTTRLIRTGWNSDQFAIVTNEPILNPAKCSTPDGYITDASQPGYNTYYAAALTAFVERVQINVIVDDRVCILGRPKLIGIDLIR